MTKTLFLLAFVIAFVANAQTDSVLSFYPLQTGNIWEYWYHYNIAYANRSESTYVTVKIIGDTLMPNGLKYKIFNQVVFGGLNPRTVFQRVDPLTGNVYSYLGPSNSLVEILTDSLFASPGDYFGYPPGLAFKCDKTDTITVFGKRVATKSCSMNVWFAPTVTLASGFGIVKSSRVDDNPNYPVYDEYVYDIVYTKINGFEYGTLTQANMPPTTRPFSMNLFQNYPNPFNPTTTIDFDVPVTSFTTLRIFDIYGREVSTLEGHVLTAGHYSRVWNADKYSSGVYFYSLTSGAYHLTKKAILLK